MLNSALPKESTATVNQIDAICSMFFVQCLRLYQFSRDDLDTLRITDNRVTPEVPLSRGQNDVCAEPVHVRLINMLFDI